MNEDKLSRNCKTKLIGGVPHMKVRCSRCNEFVWTQTTKAKKHQARYYTCNTCISR